MTRVWKLSWGDPCAGTSGSDVLLQYGWHKDLIPELRSLATTWEAPAKVAAGAHLSLVGTGCLDGGAAETEASRQGHAQRSVWEYLLTPSISLPASQCFMPFSNLVKACPGCQLNNLLLAALGPSGPTSSEQPARSGPSSQKSQTGKSDPKLRV